MTPVPVILIFDIGKTNKKVLLFNEAYQAIFEEEITLSQIKDEDGYECDDLMGLVNWMKATVERLIKHPRWDIRAINFSTFGASLVHLNEAGDPVTPLYNYLKPVDAEILDKFYSQFGEKEIFSLQTGSPALGMLNSGVQLYWLKYRRPELFTTIKCSLHFPQYLAYLFSGKYQADITSVGCHTGLWDFYQRTYHDWLDRENLKQLLPKVESYETINEIHYQGKKIVVGIGLHDSSASLLPFNISTSSPAAILSTGTWNITLLPAFKGELKKEDYRLDCLYYLLSKETPVAAARIYLGNEMEFQLKKLNAWFSKPADYHLSITPDYELLDTLQKEDTAGTVFIPETMGAIGSFKVVEGEPVELKLFSTFEEAYHKLMIDIVRMQKMSMDILFAKSPVEKVYVTGGFAKNQLFMLLLQRFYPKLEFCRASVNNGTALGAALAVHKSWNTRPLESIMVELVRESTSPDV